MRVKEHLIQNSVRITNWTQMREEILEITRTQQNIDSQPSPTQLGANPKSKGKGKESKGKGKGKDVKSKGKGKDAKNESSKESKERRSEKVFLLQQVRPRECRVQKETERPCRRRGETGGRVATSSKRHSSSRAVAVVNSQARDTCQRSPCDCAQAVRSSCTGSIAPAETTHVKPIAAIRQMKHT